jgi:hypothetical protein
MGILGWPWRRSHGGSSSSRGTVIVPEGFRVDTWSGEARFPIPRRANSGVLLASTGPAVDINLEVVRVLFDQIDRQLSEPHGPVRIPTTQVRLSDLFDAAAPEVVLVKDVVLWIFQEGILEEWAQDAVRLQEMLQRLHGFSSSRRGTNQFLQMVLVRRSYFDEAPWVFGLIQSLGIEVRELSSDGAALLEVHRPDGTIISSVLGTPIETAGGFELHRFAREREIANLRGDRGALERIDEEERRIVESAILPARRAEPPRPLELAPRLRRLIVEAADADAAAREKLERYLLERTTPLIFVTRAASGGRLEPFIDEVGAERALRAFPDLQSTIELAPPDRNDAIVPMRPPAVFDMCRSARLALVLEVPGKDGPVRVILRPREIDELAR